MYGHVASRCAVSTRRPPFFPEFLCFPVVLLVFSMRSCEPNPWPPVPNPLASPHTTLHPSSDLCPNKRMQRRSTPCGSRAPIWGRKGGNRGHGMGWACQCSLSKTQRSAVTNLQNVSKAVLVWASLKAMLGAPCFTSVLIRPFLRFPPPRTSRTQIRAVLCFICICSFPVRCRRVTTIVSLWPRPPVPHSRN